MSSVGSVSQNGLNFTGLATGIDTSSIIRGLTSISQKRIDGLKSRQADIAIRQATFATLRGQLFDLQSKTAALARSAGGAFDGRQVTVSDPSAVAAAAGTAAVPGTYQVTVNSLAKAAQTASDGFADPNAVLKTGTLSIQVGGGTAVNVTVDSRNNTLQGLADSINVAGGDVRAAVLNDGSATPYRLLLTSNKTGAANAITVTNNLTAGTGAAIDPLARTVQAATDAVVALGGGGAAGLIVHSGSNVVNNLVPGVTLTLQSADPAKTVNLTVANDTTAAVKSVREFADAFNAVKGFIADQTKFDATTGAAGTLLGNGDVAELANQLSDAISTSLPGLSANANRLSSAGLSFDDGGKLVLDENKLSAALAGTGGAAPPDFKRLFALSGSSDNPGVAFAIGTTKTKPSGGTPYQAAVTAAAARAVVVATGPPGGTVIITPANNALQIRLNRLISLGITVNSGTYTLSDLTALASQIQLKINAHPDNGGNLVSVGASGGKLQIATQQFGSAAAVAVTGGSAAADLGFLGTESGSGTDVAGHFTVGGVSEAATGNGQVLSGRSGNANTDGLQVRSSLAAPGTANVTVTQGLASRLNTVLDRYLNAGSGKLKAIDDQFTRQSADLDKTIGRQNDILKSKTDELTQRFAALESTVSNLKNVGAGLTALLGKTSTSN